MMALFQTAALTAVLLLASACGDSPPEGDDTIDVQDTLSGCVIVAEKFDLFFEEDIGDQLRCLEQRLHDFSRYVRRQEPNYISKNELQEFVDDFFHDNAPLIHGGIDTLFKINSLFSNIRNNRLSINDMGNIFTILREGNATSVRIRRASELYRSGRLDSEAFRSSFTSDLTGFSQTVLENTNLGLDAPGETTFINDVLTIIDNYDFPLGILRGVQLAKKLLVGGEKNAITTQEIRILANKVPALSDMLFDLLYYAEELADGAKKGRVGFVGRRIRTALSLIRPQEGILFYVDELIDALPDHPYLPPPGDIAKILRWNKSLLLGKPEEYYYTYEDIVMTQRLIKMGFDTLSLYQDVQEAISGEGKVDFSLKVRQWSEAIAKEADLLYPETMRIGEFIDRLEAIPGLLPPRLAPSLLGILTTKTYLVGGQRDRLRREEIKPLVQRAALVLPPVVKALVSIGGDGALPGRPTLLSALRAIRDNLMWAADDEVFLDENDLRHILSLGGFGDDYLPLIRDSAAIYRSRRPTTAAAFIEAFFSAGPEEARPTRATLTFGEVGGLFDLAERSLNAADGDASAPMVGSIGDTLSLLRTAHAAGVGIKQAQRDYREQGTDLASFKALFVQKATDFSRSALNHPSLVARLLGSVAAKPEAYATAYLPPQGLTLAKRLLVGGDGRTISAEESTVLLGKLPSLSGLIFDILYADQYDLPTPADSISFAAKALSTILGLVEPQEGILVDADNLEGALAEKMGLFTASDITDILKWNKHLLLGKPEEDPSYSYEDIQESRKILAIAIETFDLYIEMSQAVSTAAHNPALPPSFGPRTELWRQNVLDTLSSWHDRPHNILLGEFVYRLKTSKGHILPEASAAAFLDVLATKSFFVKSDARILEGKNLEAIVSKASHILPPLVETLITFRQEGNDNLDHLNLLRLSKAVRAQLRRGDGDENFLDMDDIRLVLSLAGVPADMPYADIIEGMLPIYKRRILSRPIGDENPKPYQKEVSAVSFASHNLPDDTSTMGMAFPEEDGASLTFAQTEALLSIAEDILTTNVVAAFAFDRYEGVLHSRLAMPPSGVPTRDDSPFFFFEESTILSSPPDRFASDIHGIPRSLLNDEEIASALSEISHIIRKFKYFRGQDGLQTYDRSYHRHKRGLVEIITMRKVFNLLIHAYRENAQSPPDSLPQEGLEQVLLDMKPLLEFMGIWTEYFETFPRNVLLLADIFQHTSNGDLRMGLDEAVEFVGLIMTALRIRTTLIKELVRYCKNIGGPHDEAFDADCYRTNFFSALFAYSELHRKHLPNLQRYFEESPPEESERFLTSVELFTRPDTPTMEKKHFTLLIGALLNIESTFMRYDLDGDNILSQRELYAAYPTYKNVLSLISGSDDISILFYIVHKMAPPQKGLWETIQYLRFRHSFNNGYPPESFGKRVGVGPYYHEAAGASPEIFSKRINVGVILYSIIMSSADIAQ